MSAPGTSRREFLVTSLSGFGAAWVAANYEAITAAAAYAQQTATVPVSYQFFTPEQAADVDAMAAQIIPTDSTPGAREAHVVFFIDHALATFERDRQDDYRKGLADLQARTRQMFPASAAFASLTPAQQIDLLTSIDATPFFNLVRTHTISGFFASPIHGGNANKVGWKLVNWDDSLDHKPPFGYYDRNART